MISAKNNQEYYEKFGLTRSSFTKENLHKAYRRLAKEYHPDKNKGNKEAEQKFIEITKAFEVLNDDGKRRIYDQFGPEAVDKHGAGGGGGQNDFRHAEDIFNAFFGGGGGGGFEDLFGFGRGHGGSSSGKRRSPDAKLELKVSLASLYKGETLKIDIGRQQLCQSCRGTGAKDPESVKPCQKCRGRGVETIVQQIAPGFVQQMQTQCRQCGGKGKMFKDACGTCKGQRIFHGPTKLDVTIEPGMADGAYIKFDGMSDEHPDAEPGDLYVVLRTTGPSEDDSVRFTRQGDNLYTDVHLTLSEALLGFTKDLAHLDGHKVILRSTGVTQPDQVRQVPGEGMPVHGHASQHGDLFVRYKVTFPTAFSKDQLGMLTKVFGSNPSKDEL